MRNERIPVTQLEAGVFAKLCGAIKLEKLLQIETENQLAQVNKNVKDTSGNKLTPE